MKDRPTVEARGQPDFFHRAGPRIGQRGDISRLRIALFVAVVALPFAAFTSLTLRHFYTLGGFYTDSGILSHAMGRNGLSLHTPHLYGDQSYLSFQRHEPRDQSCRLSAPQFFSAFCGLCHAVLAAGVYLATESEARKEKLAEEARVRGPCVGRPVDARFGLGRAISARQGRKASQRASLCEKMCVERSRHDWQDREQDERNGKDPLCASWLRLLA